MRRVEKGDVVFSYHFRGLKTYVALLLIPAAAAAAAAAAVCAHASYYHTMHYTTVRADDGIDGDGRTVSHLVPLL